MFLRLVIFLVLIGSSMPSRALTSPATIVSLDLCTDWLLLQYADPALDIYYSPLLYRYPNPWLKPGMAQHDGSLETILTLQPDLVLSGEFNAGLLRKRLKQLDILVNTLAFPNRFSSLQTMLQQFRQIIPLRRPIEDLSAKRYPDKHKTLLLLGANGVGTGTKTLESDLLERAGWHNYLQHEGFARLDLERLVSEPPDAVLWTQSASHSLANLFARHRALRGVVGEPTALAADWRWQCPGPWSFDLINRLAQWKN